MKKGLMNIETKKEGENSRRVRPADGHKKPAARWLVASCKSSETEFSQSIEKCWGRMKFLEKKNILIERSVAILTLKSEIVWMEQVRPGEALNGVEGQLNSF